MSAPGMDPALLDAAAEDLRGARRLLVITGAGVSAESGLPTYRGIGGLYEARDTEEGVPIEVALSGPMLARDPALTWKYLLQIGEAVSQGAPSDAHRLLARLESLVPELLVMTQNVDGYHVAAGSSRVVEIHGDCHHLYCLDCGERREVRTYPLHEVPPRCAACGGVERPDVVLFEELLPMDKLLEVEAFLRGGVDGVLAIGTTALFAYVAAPLHMAAAQGIPTFEINPGESAVSSLVRHRLPYGAGPALRALWERLAPWGTGDEPPP